MKRMARSVYICAAKVFKCLLSDDGAMRPTAVDAIYVYPVSTILQDNSFASANDFD